ncbi:ankyrin repeat-containing domain protein [Aspergillus karnatakaensis]|uniref:ankyrin repeat-containing domain protein n=1 Tax=Aspergillus karnatakaensis TaxID=1810916 RepID=UPI003CCD3FC9
MGTFSQLPDRLITRIAHYLPQRDVDSLRRTNSHLHEVLLNELYRNDIEQKSFSALHHYCRNGHLNALRGLFATIPRMDQNAKSAWNSKIHRLIKNPGVILVGHRSQVNPLFEAIENGHLHIAEYLLFEHDFLLQDSLATDKRMALGIAVEKGNIEMVQLLLRAGADIFYSSPRGSVLTVAVRNGHAELAAFLLAEIRRRIFEGAPDAVHDPSGGHGWTFYMADAMRRMQRDQRVLPLSEADYFVFTRAALRKAIDQKSTQLAELFLSEVGSLDFDGGIALIEAVEVKSVDMVKLLLRHGANPNILTEETLSRRDMARGDPGGRNATIEAAGRGLADIVEALVDAGANPDFLDGDGRTPLSHAAENGRLKIVQLLLGYGVDATRRDSVRGRRALDWAVQSRKPRVAAVLEAVS